MKKCFRKSQKFWNNDLADLWFSACQAEKMYINFRVACHGDLTQKNNLKEIFKNAQAHFDKKFRYYKRQFHSKDQNELHKLAADNFKGCKRNFRKMAP